jgi:hypothetical protein
VRGDIGFGLVVVVIADEIFDRVFREERLELAVKLRRQRLVGRQDQGRALGGLDDLGHGEGLARAGDAQQHLVAFLGVDAVAPVRRWRWAGRPPLEFGLHDETLAALEFGAEAYATEKGIDYTVTEPHTRKPNVRVRGYGENFATDRRGPWTH